MPIILSADIDAAITDLGNKSVFHKFRGALADGTASAMAGQPTATRPTKNLQIGQFCYDKTLLAPIWWNGTVWKNAAGATV
jgi:hypothetical protein